MIRSISLFLFFLFVLSPFASAQQTQTQPQTQTQTQPQPKPPSHFLRVYGPAGLRDTLEELAKIFEKANASWRVDFQPANADEITGFLKTQTPMDVFILTGAEQLSLITTQNLILTSSSSELASDDTVVAGQATLTIQVNQPKDLIFSDLKMVALPPNKGFGKLCRDYLTKAGLMESLNGKILEVKNVHDAIEKLKAGQAQWTFTSASTATENANLKLLWRVPAADIPSDVYFAAIPVYASQLHASKSFLKILHSTIAGMIFRNSGYSVPEPQPQTQTRPRHEKKSKSPTHKKKTEKKHKPYAGAYSSFSFGTGVRTGS